MIEILECKEIDKATPEEIENLKRNGFFPDSNELSKEEYSIIEHPPKE